MSADNAIAILITHDRWWSPQENWCQRNGSYGGPVWRVAHIGNPETFAQLKEHEIHNLGHWMHQTFEKAPAFKTRDEAFAHAQAEAEQLTILEHGIVVFDARPLNFPGF